MFYKVKKARVCSEDYLKKVIDGDIVKNNILLANKIISVNINNEERKLYISRCKELVYKLDNHAYLTLSDISHLNRILVDFGINHKFDIGQYERFVDTHNIVTFAGELDLSEEQENFVYLSYIQNPLEYGINISEVSYQDLKNYLNAINSFIYRKTNKALKSETIDKKNVTDNFVISSSHGCYDILEDLNTDKFSEEELSREFAYRIHL